MSVGKGTRSEESAFPHPLRPTAAPMGAYVSLSYPSFASASVPASPAPSTPVIKTSHALPMEPPRPIPRLPVDTLHCIFMYLSRDEIIFTLPRVSRHFRAAANDERTSERPSAGGAFSSVIC